MLKHQLVVAALAVAALLFSAIEARTATLPRIDFPHSSTPMVVRWGGGGGGFGHFGGGGFRHFGGFGIRHFGFAPHRTFGRFRRPVFVHRFPRRVFVRSAFFIGAPLYGYYAYGGGCAWLRYRALITGSPYWWQRYRWCRGW
jgi:hypothetical protein